MVRSKSSHLVEPLWTDLGLMSGITVRDLISTLKKKVQVGTENPLNRGKSHHHHTTMVRFKHMSWLSFWWFCLPRLHAFPRWRSGSIVWWTHDLVSTEWLTLSLSTILPIEIKKRLVSLAVLCDFKHQWIVCVCVLCAGQRRNRATEPDVAVPVLQQRWVSILN